RCASPPGLKTPGSYTRTSPRARSISTETRFLSEAAGVESGRLSRNIGLQLSALDHRFQRTGDQGFFAVEDVEHIPETRPPPLDLVSESRHQDRGDDQREDRSVFHRVGLPSTIISYQMRSNPIKPGIPRWFHSGP